MALTPGIELYNALVPILEDLGIDVNQSVAVTFNIDGHLGTNTFTVTSQVNDEQAKRLRDRTAGVEANGL